MTYETEIPIGHGTMGRVYRAWDTNRQRYVALKFLRFQDPTWVRRMKREAIAQSRLEHPNIAQVLEVGERDGRSYIAMDWIDGRPLDEVLAELAIEAGVAMLADCADAVHTAHAAGLIHRDLKPANILVTEASSGALHPFVMDFGLVLDVSDATLTADGELLGTLGYMAPEQAAGDHGAVDRRADIYSLGCILHELLTGQPPFRADSPSEVLSRCLSEDVPPPRRLAPQVPRDLERICLQCLEREPRRRYASAAALRDDLRNWLDGGSVSARRTGPAWRAHRFFRRNPAAAVLGLLFAALLCSATVWSWHAQQQAERRAAQAERTGETLKDIEWQLRGAFMTPEVDLAWHKQALRDRVRALSEELSSRNNDGRGLARYVVGRARLLLGETELAVPHLEAAFRTRASADAGLWLGYALALRYRKTVSELARIRDEAYRAQRRREIDAGLRDRALDILHRTAPNRGDSPFHGALQAWLEGRTTDAIALAKQSRAHRPWFIEALLLEADIRHTRYLERYLAGRHDDAAESLSAAAGVLVRGLATAPSAPLVYARACEVIHRADELEVRSTAAPIDRLGLGLEVCDRLVGLEPESAAYHALRAKAYSERWNRIRQTGSPPEELERASIDSARRAIELADGDVGAMQTAGHVLSALAGRLSDQPERAERLLRESLEIALWVVEATPGDGMAHNQVGIESRRLADLLRRQGRDPTALLTQAVSHLRDAVERAPDNPYPRHNLAYSLKALATHGTDPDSDPEALLREAIEQCLRAIELNPRSMLTRNTLGNIYSDLGELLLARGDPAEAVMEKALAEYRKASEIQPAFRKPYNNRANLARIMAQHRIENGLDPQRWIERGRAAAREALAIKPDYALARFNLGYLWLIEARHRAAGGHDALEAARPAMQAFETGLEDMPGVLGAWRLYAQAAIRVADAAPSARESARAVAAVQRAIERIDAMAPEHESLTELRSALARVME